MEFTGMRISPAWVQDVTAGLIDAGRSSDLHNPPFTPADIAPLVEQGPCNYGEILELMCGSELPPATREPVERSAHYFLVEPVAFASRTLFSTMLAATARHEGTHVPINFSLGSDSAEFMELIAAAMDVIATCLEMREWEEAVSHGERPALILEAEKSPLFTSGSVLSDIRAHALVELVEQVTRAMFLGGVTSAVESQELRELAYFLDLLRFTSSRFRVLFGSARFHQPGGAGDLFEMMRGQIVDDLASRQQRVELQDAEILLQTISESPYLEVFPTELIDGLVNELRSVFIATTPPLWRTGPGFPNIQGLMGLMAADPQKIFKRHH